MASTGSCRLLDSALGFICCVEFCLRFCVGEEEQRVVAGHVPRFYARVLYVLNVSRHEKSHGVISSGNN